MDEYILYQHLKAIADADLDPVLERTMNTVTRMERRLGRELVLDEKLKVLDALESPEPSTKRFIVRYYEDQVPF
jgi:hypothetical protein